MAFSPPMASSLSSPTPQHQQQCLTLQRLNSCKSMRELKQIQSHVLKSQSLQTHLIFSKILSFCAISPHGDISHARLLLAHLEVPTISMYNVVIRGISLNKKSPTLRPMFVYRSLLCSGVCPNNFTFPSLIKSLADFRAFSEGELIHAHVVKWGFESDSYVRNNLMRLYSVCGEMGLARKLFDRFPHRDLVSWTTLISGYSRLGFSEEAVSVFVEMMDEGLMPDAVIMVTVLSACSGLGDLVLGRKLHRYIDACNVDFDVFVGNALVGMYAKCGDIKSAYKIFKRMPERNVVSWNSMISGLAQNGEFKEALSLFRRMQCEGLEPDGMTLVGVLSSCANLGALELGEWVHSYMDKIGIKADGITGNALVDMYAKCGRIDQATSMFMRLAQRDVYTYTAMIVGLAMHGRTEEALRLFSEMSAARIKPNGVTFVGVLSACSHAGLVDVGLHHFQSMARVYGVTPRIEHYGCVVDMLGRAGLLQEAQEFVNRMPIEPDAFIWGALLGACMVHGNVPLGERITEKLLDLDPKEDGAYVLMSNMYASANRMGDERRVRKAMKNMKVKKTPGCSVIELDGVVHEFRMRDKAHPRRREIYTVAEGMGSHLRSEGCRSSATMEILEQVLYLH